jgi:hypothetical protein
MTFYLLIGAGAGAATALLYLSLAAGSMLAFMLFYLTPLPLFLAGFGWGTLALGVGGLSALGIIGVLQGLKVALVFLVTIALPALWLTHLAFMSRPAAAGADGGASAREWYPAGRLVIWAAIMGASLISFGMILLGPDQDSLRAMLTAMIEALTKGAAAPVSRGDIDRIVGFLAATVMPASAVIWMMTMLGNMWLAGRIARASGRLRRDWPQLAALDYPFYLALATAAALVASLLPGLIAHLAQPFLAVFVFAYALLGLAVLHTITGKLPARPFLLSAVYAGIALLGWPVLLVALTGLVEPFLKLRQRPKGTPPT